MKHLLLTGICCAAAMLSGCSDDTGFAATDSGSVRLSLDVDNNILSAQQSRVSLDDDVAKLLESFTIRLAKTDGSDVKEWPFTSFNGSDIATGSYTISAFAGEEGKEGFDAAYFYGEEPVVVKTDQTTAVSITARLANAAVRVNYSEAFRNYMQSYSASVRTAGSTEGLTYPATSDDDLFINAGEASLYVTFTTSQGQTATLKAAEFTAAAQHRYTITVDLNNGQMGDAVLKVDFDDSTVAETREFTLSEELFNAPAPVLNPADQTVSIIEGSRPAEGASVNVIAAGGLGSVTLVTDCDYLVSRGWPAELDLLKAGADMQDLLKNNGLTVRGLWNNPDKLAVIDLAGVLAGIPVDGDQPLEVSFRVEAEDALGKVSDPAAVIHATIFPLEFEVTGQELCLAGATEATLNVAFNGERQALENAKVEVFDEGAGVWDETNIISVTSSRVSASTPVYAVKIRVPGGVTDVKTRITPANQPRLEYVIARNVPDFELSVVEADIFATYAYVTVKCDAVDPASLIKSMVVSATGATGLEVKHTEGATLRVNGLNPGAAVTLKATVVDKSAETSFTTESPLAVPNGDFEDLVPSVSVSDMNVGGEWSISAGIYYTNKQSYNIQQPVGWATVNSKTACSSAKNQNSWFVVPSSLNTTLTWTMKVRKIATINKYYDPEIPLHYRDLSAQNGTNAMMLQNVGWSLDGSDPAKWKEEWAGSDDYYCHNAATVSDRSAGKLFLGSYSFENGVETYNEGTAFASRPTSLSGYYKYNRDAADPAETGTVTVTLLNGSQVIGQGTAQLQPSADYAQFTVPVTYTVRAKATSLRIMFASSNHASYDQAVESANIKTTNYMSRNEMFALGSSLTVDNLTFNY